MISKYKKAFEIGRWGYLTIIAMKNFPKLGFQITILLRNIKESIVVTYFPPKF